MSEADRERWDARYGSGEYAARTHPTELLERWLPAIPRGPALDVACGAGRNSLFLAANGFDVDGVDISEVALARARAQAAERELPARFFALDLDSDPFPREHYALVVVARFISRELVPALREALAPEGYLVYEHHLHTTAEVSGPRSRRFRVWPNELLRLFAGLRVLHYAERIRTERDGRRMALAELVACNGSGGI